jgi:hypothetical protein
VSFRGRGLEREEKEEKGKTFTNHIMMIRRMILLKNFQTEQSKEVFLLDPRTKEPPLREYRKVHSTFHEFIVS